tara:strand:- start:103 stop:408 length:306 start_codon:yes stop_codon:yes gene_type:complete
MNELKTVEEVVGVIVIAMGAVVPGGVPADVRLAKVPKWAHFQIREEVHHAVGQVSYHYCYCHVDLETHSPQTQCLPPFLLLCLFHERLWVQHAAFSTLPGP